MYQLGILGVGNMGEAILRGVIKGGVIEAKRIAIFDANEEKSAALASELHVTAFDTLPQLVEKCNMLLLAVKPNVIGNLLNLHRALFRDKAVVSIIAGWSRERLSDNLPQDARVLRVMPNTPAMVGEGMIVFEDNDTLKAEEKAFATALFSVLGRVESVNASQMDAVTGLSGSGPAYVYLFIEALADGGVQQGLPRGVAYELAAQTVLGSARMVLETGCHPGELKDRVCSPGGTTIDAVAMLEKRAFRSAVIEAVDVCTKKSKSLLTHI